ncbi:tryptase-2 [Biomphalaria glabrata]|uniref:Tryptase-2-like n=1 Tax=Biomphalaria glabrata TaxID=6526 RepID=A0A9U8DY59_BIOGL|nr:tryptase-2-like [Biomphalaria glabrata]KAI8735858.1 tryptase-2-like [Biomphalaria glabrata]KAI8742873.1 tryptase-2 [Biomphalaria glabrata]
MLNRDPVLLHNILLLVYYYPTVQSACNYVPFDKYNLDYFRQVYHDKMNIPFNKPLVKLNTTRQRNILSKFKKVKCGVSRVDPESTIIGGRTSKTFPWSVSITDPHGDHFCGGVLIASDWVLTAAHCLVLTNPILVVDKNHRDALRMIPHPDYMQAAIGNDIALIQLDSPVCSVDDLNPVCLPLEDYLFIKTSVCYITGWGIEDLKTHRAPSNLKQLQVFLLDQSICAYLHAAIPNIIDERSICMDLGDDTTSGPCQGDSGGPLQCKVGTRFYVAGVISIAAENCSATSYPPYATRVAFYTEWILKTLTENGGVSMC